MRHGWRPTLALVLGGALLGMLVLAFLGLILLRYLGPEIGFRRAAILIGTLILAATLVLGWLLVRLLLRPILALEIYARAQERGAEPCAPPHHFGTRELHATARSVIAMADALRDRETSIRSFADHVTHELKSPVAAIRAAAELLEDTGALGLENARLLAEINGARSQIEAQLTALQRATKARETRYLGQSTLAEVVPQLSAAHPGLAMELVGDDQTLPIAPDGLTIILTQLLCNAAEHGAHKVVLASKTTGPEVRLTVSDDGSGISAFGAQHIFEPFYTSRRDKGGTGMGLFIVRNILAAHRGSISLEPSDRGATFTLIFPWMPG